MNETWNEICYLYKQLEECRCLCTFVDTDVCALWYKFYQDSFMKDIHKRDECQMLCISFLQLTGEIYTEDVLNHHCACSIILQLLEIFSSDDLWNAFIHHLKCSADKHLIWTFIKSFTVILYVSSKSIFSKRIHALLKDTEENMFDKKNIYILDFLSSLVEYSIKPSATESKTDGCKKASSSICPVKDLFQSFCAILSEYWSAFMRQFNGLITSKCEYKNINKFLMLWQKLVLKHLGNDKLSLFLNEEFVAPFFSSAYNLMVISLLIYTDIIMQFFMSCFQPMLRKEKSSNCFDDVITSALSNNFFNLLPRDVQVDSFCVVTEWKDKKCSLSSTIFKDLQKYDPVIVRKVSFVFLSALTGSQNNFLLLYDAVPKIFNFIKENFAVSPNLPVHTWILDVFIDQDDILLGIMLAVLKLHIILDEDSGVVCDTPSRCVQLHSDLNPHAIFISFVQRMGFDHNELLAFLTSDETCFLLYLLQYLKLLLKEWDIFMEVHCTLIECNDDSINFDACDKQMEESENLTNVPLIKNLLVSYSSSSSDEENMPTSTVIVKNERLVGKNVAVIETLIKLKESIQKLVDVDEFPYKAVPLIALLQACEEHSLNS